MFQKESTAVTYMASNKPTPPRKMSNKFLPTTRIPLLPVPKRTNGNTSWKRAEEQIRITLPPKEWETLKNMLELSIVTIAEPFRMTCSRNINLVLINMVEEHRYKQNGQGRRGIPTISVNEYIHQCKVKRMLYGARYERIPDIPS